MKTAIFLVFACLNSLLLAEDQASRIEDFIFPLPNELLSIAKEIPNNQRPAYTFRNFLVDLGIHFPERSKFTLDAQRKTLAVQLSHQEALNLLQLINKYVGRSAEEVANEISNLRRTITDH